LVDAYGVVGQQGGDQGARRIGRVKRFPQPYEVGHGRDLLRGRGYVDAEHGVAEHDPSGFEGSEDRTQGLSRFVVAHIGLEALFAYLAVVYLGLVVWHVVG
jgi:hypothetical protein